MNPMAIDSFTSPIPTFPPVRIPPPKNTRKHIASPTPDIIRLSQIAGVVPTKYGANKSATLIIKIKRQKPFGIIRYLMSVILTDRNKATSRVRKTRFTGDLVNQAATDKRKIAIPR
jgi:hypothetical protein